MTPQALTSPNTHFSPANEQIVDPGRVRYADTIRLLDPNGRVFFWNGGVYRGIHPHRVDFVQQLFEKGIVDELAKQGLIVGTQPTDLQLEGFGLVLQHDWLDLKVSCQEWSAETFLQAAKHCLNLLAALHEHDLTLVDCHGANVSLAPGGKTVWHDFGSIVELDKYKLKSLGEFLTHYYFPLMLYRRTGDMSLVRRLGMQCSSEQWSRLWHPHLFRLVDTMPRLPGGAKVAKALRKTIIAHESRKLAPIACLRALARHSMQRLPAGSGTIQVAYKYQLLKKLQSDLSRVRIRDVKTAWGDYHSTSSIGSGDEHESNRSRAVHDLLQDSSADRVLDLGANQGLFSHMAYRYCDVVISTDYDNTAVAKHASLLRGMKDAPRIYPLVLDVTKLSESTAERLRSHTVLALALTHHLRLGQSYPFWFIAQQLSMVTDKRLITEFMPNGLGRAAGPWPNPLPDDYTLDAFLSALREEFHRVEVVEYEQEPNSSPRTLIVCDKYTVRG